MSTEEKQAKESNPWQQIQTPPPPQVIDPSRPPGQGPHETYRKGESEKKKSREGRR